MTVCWFCCSAGYSTLCMPWNTAEPAELLSCWCMVLHCVGVENSCLKLFTACQFSYFHGTCSVFHNAVPQSALLSRVRVNCCWFVSIYLSLSFIYMWTVMLMTLHTLLFHPIVVILTHKKDFHTLIIFFGQPFSAPLLDAVQHNRAHRAARLAHGTSLYRRWWELCSDLFKNV